MDNEQTKAGNSVPVKTYTAAIEILGVGRDNDGRLYLKVRARGNTCILSVSEMTRDPKDALARLEVLGVPLIEPAAQREFVKRAQIEAGKETTFKVATQVGLIDGVFVLPDGPVPHGVAGLETYFDERHGDVHRKFHQAGNRAGWFELVGLFKGNSRLMTESSLSFCGPVCAAFSLEPPGVQFVGPGGIGKTPAAKAISALWGWDALGELGFGASWKNTSAALELIAAGCNHTLVYLDDMPKNPGKVMDAVLTIAQGQGTARYTETHRLNFRMPLLSTSNTSVFAALKAGGPFDAAAYVDRLMDIPKPRGCTSFFENLHGEKDVAKFCARLCSLAAENHGRAGYSFVEKFTAELASDREGLKRYVDARRDAYMRSASSITAKKRNLTRVHGRNATIYAAGRLAIRYNILNFDREELLDAVLACERDHVAFIAEEMGHSPEDEISMARKRLTNYILENEDDFVDGQDLDESLPEDHDHNRCLGYIGVHEDRPEFWLSNERFEDLAGGKDKADLLKAHLVTEGKLKTQRRKNTRSFVVKRTIPGFGRRYVIALTRGGKG